ncbi:HupE/UreJ family protein [Epilithonimonas tenax]|uniref:HupE/UreJ family protein n=1 Tax=Epilithonimonas tenax TaxID=191577 RepID=UPI00041238DD|nr:HupE/UreJ family protein [Epilithonimonas tenax]
MKDFLFYLQLGWDHIISLDALDHQLFILALIAAYSFKDFKRLLILITAFTIGHCITLALASFDMMRVKSSWIEFLIPCTIVITALDNILFRGKRPYQYYFALFFGLIHGMGFANTARMMLAKEQSITVPLLGFNVGLELGQIVMVLLILVILTLVTKFTKLNERDWLLITSSAAGALALQMALERVPF